MNNTAQINYTFQTTDQQYIPSAPASSIEQLWQEALPIYGTPAHKYFYKALARGSLPQELRYVPKLYCDLVQEDRAAVLSPITGGNSLALHIMYLDENTYKIIYKLNAVYGNPQGGAIKFYPPYPIHTYNLFRDHFGALAAWMERPRNIWITPSLHTMASINLPEQFNIFRIIVDGTFEQRQMCIAAAEQFRQRYPHMADKILTWTVTDYITYKDQIIGSLRKQKH